jgi:uncharacterized protein (TIGR00730 family)
MRSGEIVKRVCVFCGSSPGKDSDYLAAARELGDFLVNRQIGLVYGGGRVGLMGEIARTIHQAGGEVIGVIPQHLLDLEVGYTELSDLRVVHSMHERKALMAELSDAFIAMPGGLGTLEEFFEVVTWSQLSLHEKPCGLFNVNHYYDLMIEFLDHAVESHFINPAHRGLVLADERVEGLFEKFESFKPVRGNKGEWALRLTDGGR